MTIAIVLGGFAIVGVATAAKEHEVERWNDQHAPSDFEVCAILAMKHHHEQALDLSRALLQSDSLDSELREYATFIAVAQTAEIATMDSWIEAWADERPTDVSEAGHHQTSPEPEPQAAVKAVADCTSPTMSGMATLQEMEALEATTGENADIQFIDLMITHHEGAIVMARETIGNSQNAYVLSSARHTITEQTLEIAQLRSMRR